MNLPETNAGQTRVIYDDHSKRFYTESLAEGITRKELQRRRIADVKNRAHEVRLGGQKKRDQTVLHMREMRWKREEQEHRNNLKRHVAYSRVLKKLTRTRETRVSDRGVNLGQYGPGVCLPNLTSAVSRECEDLTAATTRRDEASRLLTHRRRVSILDRTLPTVDFFQYVRERYTGSERNRTENVSLPKLDLQAGLTSRPKPNSYLDDPTDAANIWDRAFITQKIHPI